MALTIPNRFVDTQVIDAAKFNSNFDAITTWAATNDGAVDTAQADIVTNATTAANLGKGAFFAYATDNQAITATTYTTVTLDDTGTDAFDTNSYFAANVYTPLVAGAYQFNVNLQVLEAGFATDETLAVYITKNTTRYKIMDLQYQFAHGGSGSILLKANGTTDTFMVEVYASAALSINWAQFSGLCVKPD